MAVPKKIIVTVGGVPFDELTEEHKQKIIKRNTDIVAEMVTREVIKMAEEGKSTQEIGKFLGIENDQHNRVCDVEAQ